MKKVYIIKWEDICPETKDMNGISGVFGTLKGAKIALERLKKYEKQEIDTVVYEDIESMIEDFTNGFVVNFGYHDYKMYEIVEREVEY